MTISTFLPEGKPWKDYNLERSTDKLVDVIYDAQNGYVIVQELEGINKVPSMFLLCWVERCKWFIFEREKSWLKIKKKLDDRLKECNG